MTHRNRRGPIRPRSPIALVFGDSPGSAASVSQHPLVAPERRSDDPSSSKPPQNAHQNDLRRWSGDAWLVWRQGSSTIASVGPATPVYGASQAGAVLRYDLATGSRHHPQAYIRAVSAFASEREQDLAAGLEVRPFARLPITAHGELRLSRRQGGTTLQPAAFVSGGIDDERLPAGVSARGYAQAGYVGGRYATAFADASLIAEKPLWRGGETVLAAGAGTWGGVQRGAARLDFGPTAGVRFRLGQTAARVSADYRFRVAGNAAPASGAALTLSAGF